MNALSQSELNRQDARPRKRQRQLTEYNIQSELNRQGARPRKRQWQLTECNICKAHANVTELARFPPSSPQLYYFCKAHSNVTELARDTPSSPNFIISKI